MCARCASRNAHGLPRAGKKAEKKALQHPPRTQKAPAKVRERQARQRGPADAARRAARSPAPVRGEELRVEEEAALMQEAPRVGVTGKLFIEVGWVDISQGDCFLLSWTITTRRRNRRVQN